MSFYSDRDWRVEFGTNQTTITLASHVKRVRPGTPLRPAGESTWEISPTGSDAKWIAAHNEVGGNKVDVWRSATFFTYLRGEFRAGDELAIEYIDDDGRIHLVKRPKGGIDAIDNERIFVSVPLI